MFKLFKNSVPFWLAVLFIAGASSFDSYMSAKAGYELGPVELNPMAKYLIDLDGGAVSLLIGCKTFGTVIALLICSMLRDRRYKNLDIVIWSLIAVQIAVLVSYVPFLFVH